MVWLRTERHVVVLPLAHEIHLIVVVHVGVFVAVFASKVDFVAVTLVISFVPHVIATLRILIILVVVVYLRLPISVQLIIIDGIRLVLRLHLEDAEAVNIEQFADFDVHLLFHFDLVALGLHLQVHVVYNSEGGPILKAEIN